MVIAALCLTSTAAAQGTPDPTGSASGGIAGRARINPRQTIAFHAAVMPETVYVGQQATYQVGVFLSEEVRTRLRRNPEFVPPEVRSMLAFDLPSPTSMTTRVVGSRRYDVHVFQRALFPLTPGRQVIPSARLNYALPLSNSFFAREESHSERTGSVVLVSREPPLVGRPTDYHGAVGRLGVVSAVDGRRARVGDPLTVTVTVDGVGNVTLLPRPDLQIAWADVVAGGERVQLDTTAVLLRGNKAFDWIITPRKAGSFTLPAVRYPFFNPYTEQYEVALTRPETLKVAPGSVVAGAPPAKDSVPALPIRRLYAGEEPLPLSSRAAYWLAIALAPLPALIVANLRRPARRTVPTHERTLRDLATKPGPVDAATLRRAYAAAVASRVVADASAMSNHKALVRTLRHAGVSDATARKADKLLAELDQAVFGRGSELPPDAARRARQIVSAIDAEARTRQDLAARAARATALLLLLITTTAAAAASDLVAERTFHAGVAQYDARQYAAARETFFELARARPRSANAWFNFGTASWQAHDTAAAVIGWQHALRLAPLSSDVRQRLELTPGFNEGFLGDVPPVSLTILALLGGALWCAGWGLSAWRLWRRHPSPWRAGTPAIVLAVLVALAGLRQRDTLESRDAAVVINSTRFRSAPALGAETGAEALTGEVGRVIGRQGAWTRLRLSDGRRGWVEARRLQSLGVE